MRDYTQARKNMVDCQLRTNKLVQNEIIDAFLKIPREKFVDASLEEVAYSDKEVSTGSGRKLIQPMLLARMIQSFETKADDVVLDVGCTTGYSSAIMADLVATVVALESDVNLAKRATENFISLSIDNAVTIEGPLIEGYAAQGPYDIICVAGAIAFVPDTLIEQLAEGGRLGAVIGNGKNLGQVVKIMKKNGHVVRLNLFNAYACELPGFEKEGEFKF